MAFEKGFLEDRTEQNETKEALLPPEIFNLIDKNAGSNVLIEQVYKDFYEGDEGKEKVALGLKAIIDRGLEGRAALQFLASGSDELARTVSAVLNGEKEDTSWEDIERALGIKRYSTPLDSSRAYTEFPYFKEKIFPHLQEKGLVSRAKSAEACFKDAVNVINYYDYAPLPPHYSGALESEILAGSATFGLHEPSYLELLGPYEILRLRSKAYPRFLLLGSMGVYSARQFADYTKKINPQSEAHVIDIDDRSIDLMHTDPNKREAGLVQGDATELPYGLCTLDQVCTNYLFHMLSLYGGADPHKSVGKIFSEVSRVLVPGGSFLVKERPYGRHGYHGHEPFRREVRSVARRAGFIESSYLTGTVDYLLQPEAGTARISQNGFSYYDGLMDTAEEGVITARYTKI
jgi:SAM-dependent methyltransferase